MKFFISALLIWLSVLQANSQHLTYQNCELGDTTKVELTSILERYLNNELKPEDIFTQFDIKKYKTIDIMKESLSLGGSLYNITFETNVLSIKKEVLRQNK